MAKKKKITLTDIKPLDIMLSPEMARKLIMDCDLKRRSRNCLISYNILTVGELVCLSEEEILKIRNTGNAVLQDIKSFLEKNNLSLDMKNQKKNSEKDPDDFGGLTLV